MLCIKALCLFSAILRISQVLVNLSDSSRVKPHSSSNDQARSGPMALANRSATFSTLIGEGPSLKFPLGGFCGAGLVLLFCTRCRRSFHSSTVSGIQPLSPSIRLISFRYTMLVKASLLLPSSKQRIRYPGQKP